MNKLLLLLLLSLLYINASDQFNLNEHLASKSPYPDHNNHTYTPPPANCHVQQINMVLRHGVRNPSKSYWPKINSFLQRIQNHSDIVSDEYKWLLTYKNPFNIDENGLLVDNGIYDHFNIGKRISKAFPVLFDLPYNALTHNFTTTAVERTAQSASASYLGLFSNQKGIINGVTPVPVISSSKSLDNQLRFFKTCKQYTNLLKYEENRIYKQYDKYMEGEQYKYTIDRVNQRIFSNNTANIITALDLITIYNGCGYEYSVYNDTKHLCSILESDDMYVLEFASDLLDYYIKGYGTKLAYQISNILADNMVNEMKEGKLKVSMRYAHAETLMPLQCLLGIRNDSFILKANISINQQNNRKFRASKLIPFATNIAFIVYNCSDNNELLLKVLHNEKEIILPACNDELYCPINVIEQLIKDNAPLSFESMCDIANNNSIHKHRISTVLILMISLCSISVVLWILLIYKHKKSMSNQRSRYEFEEL